VASKKSFKPMVRGVPVYKHIAELKIHSYKKRMEIINVAK
jgi:hypothetical protein